MEQAVYERMARIDRDHWWFVGRRRIVRRLLARFAPAARPLRILEVGCGTGSNIALLREFGEVEAVEPDAWARGFARQRTGARIHAGTLAEVALEDGRYDLIVLLDVLEHIADDAQALALIRTKLAPGGRLLLTVPALPALWSGHDVAHHHQRRYTRATLARVVGQAGYRIVHRGAFNTVLLPVIAGARAINKLRGRRGADDDRMPPAWLNGLLAGLFGAERYAAGAGLLPIGLSLALVAEPGSTR
jgi:SAM-dependent methyltransferase